MPSKVAQKFSYVDIISYKQKKWLLVFFLNIMSMTSGANDRILWNSSFSFFFLLFFLGLCNSLVDLQNIQVLFRWGCGCPFTDAFVNSTSVVPNSFATEGQIPVNFFLQLSSPVFLWLALTLRWYMLPSVLWHQEAVLHWASLAVLEKLTLPNGRIALF